MEEYKNKAQELLNKAKNEPAKARQYLLDAAQVYLDASKIDKANEETYIKMAAQVYEQAMKISQEGKVKELRRDVQLIQNNEGIMFSTPTVNFDDICGLEAVKDEIKLKIIEPLRHPEVFSYFGKKVGGGVLMYGPPGCGKSLIAEATAGECGISFFHVKPSDIKGKYVGETEKNVSELFKVARSNQPCIIFFDEFESLGGDRGKSDPYTKLAVSQLLTEMDGLGAKNDQILLLAATNEPWNIDLAFKREGRFGATIFIPPPDIHARFGILSSRLERKPVSKDVNPIELALKTEGYSGADLVGLVEAATDIPLKEFLETRQKREISKRDFEEALNIKRSFVEAWFNNARTIVRERKEQDLFPELFEREKQLCVV